MKSTFPDILLACPKSLLKQNCVAAHKLLQSQARFMTIHEVHPTISRRAVRLEDGRVCVFKRDGIYQARIRTDNGRYLWRSLRTRNQITAISAARRLYHEIEFRRQNGLPTSTKIFSSVINEYLAVRERQHAQGRTTVHMLRHVRRISKFWREYIGSLNIETIGNKELSGYVEWRKAYYSQVPSLPKNAKLNPTDKTLQWEMMLGKAMLKWAHDQGYRGNQPLPSFTFTPKTKRVRPAFEVYEYRRLLRTLIEWQRDCANRNWLHTRQLLTDYVLVLANSGMRVGEANNLKIRDVEAFEDGLGRRNYRFKVKGKTGERDVILQASAAKSVDRLLARKKAAKPNDWLLAMSDGRKIIALIDQFDAVLKLAGIVHNSHGDKYTLYSLRHFYAVLSLRRGIGVFDVARNMGTSVQMIQAYYGKHATPMKLATQLGG